MPRFKLWQQGLALVAVLLCVELAIIGQLWSMLQTAQRESDKAAHAEYVITRLKALGASCYESGKSLGMYLAFQLPDAGKKFDKENAKVLSDFADLENSLRQDAGAVEALQPLKKALYDCQDELMKSKTAVDRGERWTDKQFKHKVMPKIAAFAKELERLTNEDQEPAKENARLQEAQMRQSMERLLQVATIANVLLAVVLISFLMRNIIRGLNRLADNSFRLAQGKMLHPVMQGKDEIAQLDQAFHDMAKALQEASQKEHAALGRTESIIEHMPVGIVTIDTDGLVRAVNPRTERMFGLQQTELIGRHFCEFFAPATVTEPGQFFQELLIKSLNKVSEYKARRRDGSIFPVEVSLDQFSAQTGESFLANILDISERYEAERLKREFVAMVSHDLRTPLTSVEATLTLLSAGAFGDLPGKAKETVSLAEVEVVRLRNLVSDLLDIAKIEAGKMDIKFANFELEYLVTRSCSATVAVANQHDVDLQISDVTGTAYGDSDRLIQVLVNLLSNAVKYTPAGGTITISSRNLGQWHELRVTDQGPGVPHEYKEAIFHKFEQVKGSQQKSGTGLGLTISKVIVEQHGGSIGVIDNESGVGSTFWFRIPAASVALPVSASRIDEVLN